MNEMDRVWYESQVTRYATLFEDGDTNTHIYHIETYGVIQTIESEVMRFVTTNLARTCTRDSEDAR